jgi:predicted SnoaL-like aldol condensation-catalyzing enzyme
MMLAVVAIFVATMMAATTSPVEAADKGADLKRIATEYYNAAINEKDFDKASKYLAPKYIQHSPTAPDGAEGLKKVLDGLKATMPAFHGEIRQSFVDGKTVIFHVFVTRKAGDPGLNVVDIIRFDDNDKIAEHWDVVDQLPEKVINPNPPV